MSSTNEHTSGVDPRPAAEGFKVYLRVPENAQEISADTVQKFIAKFAKLLSDEGKHISVETYDGPDGALRRQPQDDGQQSAEARSAHAADTSDSPHDSGGAGSALIPLYVCHNKY